MASPIEIAEWVQDEFKRDATHVLIVTDTFDYEEYPVPVMPNEDVQVKINEFNSLPMQKVIEVYSKKYPLIYQLNTPFAWFI